MKTLYHARLFASEEDGQSCFEDVPVDLEREMVFPPLAERLPCSLGMIAESVSWIEAPQGWNAQQPHLPAHRTMLVTLKGEYQVQASDGETRNFPVGSVLLLDDVRAPDTPPRSSARTASPCLRSTCGSRPPGEPPLAVRSQRTDLFRCESNRRQVDLVG